MSLSKTELEASLERIQSHKGVVGVIVLSSDGAAIRSTMDNSTTLQYVNMCRTMSAMARSTVRDIDPQDDLTILRIRTRKHEIMIAPERNRHGERELCLMVIQTDDNPQVAPVTSLLV